MPKTKKDSRDPKEEEEVSNNSILGSDSEADHEIVNKRKQKIKTQRKLTVKTVKVPKKYFDNVYKNLTSGKAITAHEQQPNIKHQCDRNIATQLNCAQNVVDGICSDSVTKLICEMRACLLRRDWHNLARLISLYAEMPLGKERWYPIVLRYSLISLLHDPVAQNTDLLDNFLEGVIGCQTDEDKHGFLENITELPSNIHADTYDNLWNTDNSTNEHFLTKNSLKKLNALLSKKMTLNDNDENGKTKNSSGLSADNDTKNDDNSDDAWESTDESDDDNNGGNTAMDLDKMLSQSESDYTEAESITSNKNTHRGKKK